MNSPTGFPALVNIQIYQKNTDGHSRQLATFIPLLEKLMTEKRRKTRVALAMLGFLSAILIIQNLINLKKKMKEDKFLKSIC